MKNPFQSEAKTTFHAFSSPGNASVYKSIIVSLCHSRIVWIVLLLAVVGGAHAQTRDWTPTYPNTYPRANYNPWPSGDLWGFFNRQCTSYVAWKLNERLGRTSAPWVFTNASVVRNGVVYSGRWGNAYEWDNRARAHGFEVNSIPNVGAIAHWDIGEGYASDGVDYGHIAWVERVNTDGSVDISEYNIRRNAFSTCRNIRARRYIHVLPSLNPPSALWLSSLSHNAVGISWLGSPGVNQFRIHISRNQGGWTPTNGWDPSESRWPTTSVPVNSGTNNSSYTWYGPSSYSGGSPGSLGGPQPGVTYWYSVRQHSPVQGASTFSTPRSFTVPYPVGTPSLTLSATSITRSVTQYTSPTPSSFTIRNSGYGNLVYYVTSNVSWMSVSPSSGSSTGETDTILVNFNTTGYTGPQTLTGSLTVNAGAAGSRVVPVTVSITGAPAAPADDHGDSITRSSYLPVWSGLNGRLERGGDRDVFRITIGSAGTRTFTSSSTIDTWGTLMDASGRVLREDDDSGTDLNFQIIQYLPAGTYYLLVRGYSSYTTGSYTLYAW